MTTEITTVAPAAQAVPAAQSPSLVARFASRYGVDATKMMATLKATVFKAQKVGSEVYEASNEELMALMVVADQYKLNPFTKEIYAFPDTKRGGIVPVVSVDGWARIINDHPQFDGLDFEMAEDGSACTCVIYRKDRSHPIRVTEYLAEVRRDTGPWKSHPRRMLRHKALIQCARIAFGFAGIYDEDEAERIIDVTPTPAAPSAGARAAAAAAAKAAEAARAKSGQQQPAAQPAPEQGQQAADPPASGDNNAAQDGAAAAETKQGEGPAPAADPAGQTTTTKTGQGKSGQQRIF